MELRVELTRLQRAAGNDPNGPFPVATVSPAAPGARVEFAELVRVDDLRTAPSRHRLLRRFADRVANCFGEPRQHVGFDVGPLHDADGPVGGFGAFGWLHHDGSFTMQDAVVSETGAVRRPADLAAIGWWEGGVAVDLGGDVVAALEFATSESLPSDFFPTAVWRPDTVDDDTWERERSDPGLDPPIPTRRWSGTGFREFITGMTYGRHPV